MEANPKSIYQQIVELGEAWADSNAAADILEESKKSVLSQIMTEAEDGSHASREAYALRSDKYKEHLKAMIEARRLANRAKVNHEATKIKAEMWRTQQANERAIDRLAP